MINDNITFETMTFQNAISRFTEATSDDLYDVDFNPENPWLIEATETQETIDEFVYSSKTWKESSSPEFGELNGLPFVYFPHVQVKKGDRRTYLSVVDFGEKRIAMEVNLTDY